MKLIKKMELGPILKDNGFRTSDMLIHDNLEPFATYFKYYINECNERRCVDAAVLIDLDIAECYKFKLVAEEVVFVELVIKSGEIIAVLPEELSLIAFNKIEVIKMDHEGDIQIEVRPNGEIVLLEDISFRGRGLMTITLRKDERYERQ